MDQIPCLERTDAQGESIVLQNYFDDGSGKAPRYYQVNDVNAAIEAIDECHRGNADADSAWREILTYFSSATQIGMTATPKETCYVSNIHYFGEAVYSYSLKQGIQDGFLAPYNSPWLLMSLMAPAAGRAELVRRAYGAGDPV